MKVIKLLKKIKPVIKNDCYIKEYKKNVIDDKMILLECQHGREVNGNIFYLLKELKENDKYKDYKVYLSANKKSEKRIKRNLKKNNLSGVNVVRVHSKVYYQAITTAKYLINDNTFLPFFIKKKGQVYLNTWHGTPLKTLGKRIKNDFHNIGNAQKNMIVADYLLYPNEYTRDIMLDDYMVRNLSNAKVILDGYPRNTAFFDEEKKKEIIEKLELAGKKVIAYMPTWRGTLREQDTDKQGSSIQSILCKIDSKLSENEVLYVNLHPIEKATVDYSNLKNIKPFPEDYETYDFLNVSDVLITDYSSVFFDYAVTKKKIILFPYDKDEYLKERGLYMQLEELPFPIVYDVDTLLKEISADKKYDDSDFLQRFCKYDNKDATKKLCETFILNKKNEIKISDIEKNKNDNILIYAGGLNMNGITTSIHNLLSAVDVTKKNYYIYVDAKRVEKQKDRLLDFPEEVNFITSIGDMNLPIDKKIFNYKFRRTKKNFDKYIKVMQEYYQDEVKRIFGNAKFSHVIHFSGYEFKKIMLFSQFKCKKIIYMHSDVKSEVEIKKNQIKEVVEYAFREFDKIAIVTEDLREKVEYFMKKKDYKKIHVVTNLINYKHILDYSTKEVEFIAETESNISKEELVKVLKSKNKKFISIGRYAIEKNHVSLLNCFDKLWHEDNSIYLIIIGGYGPLYEETLKYAESLDSYKNIFMIKTVNNPYSILKQCDYFVLSSLYEGFGLVLAEADICGLPVISTDIVGPQKFMRENNGRLVPETNEGIYEGMKDLLDGKVKVMNVDYEKYNKNAVSQFEKLFK